MSIQISIKHLNDSTVRSHWPFHAYVTCDYCGRDQHYQSIREDLNCISCSERMEIPLLLISDFPFIFKNEIQRNIFEEKLESSIVAALLLDYPKPAFTSTIWGSNKMGKLQFASKELNTAFDVFIMINDYAQVTTFGFKRYSTYYKMETEQPYVETEDLNKIFDLMIEAL